MRSRVCGKLAAVVEVGDSRITLSWRAGAVLLWSLVMRDVDGGIGMARPWVSSLFSVRGEVSMEEMLVETICTHLSASSLQLRLVEAARMRRTRVF